MIRRSCVFPFIAIGALAIGLAACDHMPIVSEFRELSPEGWETDDTLRFDIDSIEEAGDYALYVCLRTTVTPAYPFRSISLETVRRQTGDIRTDTLSLQLIPEKVPQTEHGISLRQHDFPIDTLRLEKGKRISLTLRHIMRRTPLPGIRNAGIRLEKLQ